MPTNSGVPETQLEQDGTACADLAADQVPGSGEAAVDPVVVAYEARASMELPAPQMGGSPALEAEQLVGVPTWLWVDHRDWEPVSAEASVPGGSVEVTAAPTTTVWELGGDTRVECAGPGTAYDPAVHTPEAASPDCGHTFTRSSADAPGGAFPVGVEVTWNVAWSSSEGEGGELEPLTTRAQERVEVTESHGVVTR
ncbi:hypothetical protein [Streptomonospora salina]|uniref:ATP/GTP-binding protein n=1 Tax=Streptomonospora salina TaxID=104205 RepID=A0A841EGY5_9ACTN|nr:hypothetical protein [Streptomonospora salina]MBB6000098.1 hypothetical protein [Streptomonospora salina]